MLITSLRFYRLIGNFHFRCIKTTIRYLVYHENKSSQTNTEFSVLLELKCEENKLAVSYLQEQTIPSRNTVADTEFISLCFLTKDQNLLRLFLKDKFRMVHIVFFKIYL